LDLFSGIGGFALAARWMKWETVAFCEPDEFCQRVLRKNFPGVPIIDSIQELDTNAIGFVDIVTGGYPCQPYSVAGKRGGAEDDRDLWPAYFQVIRENRPRWAIGENTPGHLTLGIDDVLANLESIGYAVETFVIPACAVDARHRRDRVFWVAADADQNAIRQHKQWTTRRRVDVPNGGNAGPGDNGGAQSMADADGGRREGERIEEYGELESARGSFANGCSSRRRRHGQTMADAARDLHAEQTRGGSERERIRPCGKSPDVADADGERLQNPHGDGKLAGKRSGFDRESDRSGNDAECAGGFAESRMGRLANGVSGRLGRTWEPEPDIGRTAVGVKERKSKLHALGNAVVPQVVLMLYEAIAEVERNRCEC
jgi:DNA (cytosine-5)-methyltransferase 1